MSICSENKQPFFTAEDFKTVFSPPMGDDDLEFIAERAEAKVAPLVEALRGTKLVQDQFAEANTRSLNTIMKLQARIAELEKALEYYAHPDHYVETMRLSGMRPPGVLVEGGKKAREVLGK